jgi:hypothetical protein
MEIRIRRFVTVAVVALAVAAHAGCRSKQHQARRVAAEVAGQTIYVDELDEKIVAEIFELRSMALHKMVADKLITQEAERRKVSLHDLWNQEVDQKVPAPDEGAARRAVEQWVAEGHITAAEAARITPALAVERLRHQQMQQHEDAYYNSLVDRAAVQIDFGALGKPWLKIANDGPSLGPSDAAITVVEFSDLTQSFTSIWQPTLQQLVDRYGNRVRFRFKQKPSHPDSPSGKLAEASLCADEQHGYWEFRKALLRDGVARPVGTDRLDDAVAAAHLDGAAFAACLASGRTRTTVASNVAEAQANHLEGEPVVSVNGIRLSGAHSFATVDRLLRIETSRL